MGGLVSDEPLWLKGSHFLLACTYKTGKVHLLCTVGHLTPVCAISQAVSTGVVYKDACISL